MAARPGVFDLSGKAALVTGGGTGLGRAIAAGLARHGARVLLGARNVARLDRAARELNQLAEGDRGDLKVAAVPLDVVSASSVDRAVRKAVDLFGRLDILVNAAGFGLLKPAFELTAEQFNQVHEVHVTGSFRCALAAGHFFREQHDGCIINLAPIGARPDVVEVTASAAARNAVLGLTRSLANEWARYGIRTNAIAPGRFPTDPNRPAPGSSTHGAGPLAPGTAAWAEAADGIAGPAVFLASPAARFVNGHTLVIDGSSLAAGFGARSSDAGPGASAEAGADPDWAQT